MITLEPPRDSPATADPWPASGLSRAALTRFLRSACSAVGMDAEVEVLLSDDRTLRHLNRDFRGKNKATDVLSFPALESLAAEHAGDLAVSLETAGRQAEEHGHSLQDEVKVLLLHGLLHLDGMDHETDTGEMAEREAALRRKLRLPVGLIARAEVATPTAAKNAGKNYSKLNARWVRASALTKTARIKRALAPEATAGTRDKRKGKRRSASEKAAAA